MLCVPLELRAGMNVHSNQGQSSKSVHKTLNCELCDKMKGDGNQTKNIQKSSVIIVNQVLQDPVLTSQSYFDCSCTGEIGWWWRLFFDGSFHYENDC